MGDHSESLVGVKTHNEKAPTARDSQRWQWEEKGQCTYPNKLFGAVTRISGDPSWNRLGKYMEWAAVDTLVRLTKGNVDTAHTS